MKTQLDTIQNSNINEKTGFDRVSFFLICKKHRIMSLKTTLVPDEVLSKEFLSLFKTEAMSDSY